MRSEHMLLGIGEYLVRRACQQLPRDIRRERYLEWAAELPVILQDRQIGTAPRRALRMLAYAADTLRAAARTPAKGRRQLLLTAVFCLLLAAGLAVAGWNIKAIAVRPGDPLNYLRLGWAVLLTAYPATMLRRSALRPGMLIVSAGSLTGAAVSLWDATRSPADWANYFSATLLLLLALTMWIVNRRTHARRA